MANTDILEYVAARYRDRLTGRLRSLFDAAWTYFNVARGPLTREALSSLLMRNEPDLSKHDDYLALFDALTDPPYDSYNESNRRWFLHEYDLQWQINETGNALASAAELMRSGYQAHGKDLLGAEAAWQFLAEQRLRFTNLTSGSAMSEAEFTQTTGAAKEYYKRASEQTAVGAKLSLPEAQERLPLLRPGDLFMVVAFAHEGKSMWLLNDAHYAWKNGGNVSIASGEMNIHKYRNRFIALHSCEPHFEGPPLQTFRIDYGLLTPEEYEKFLLVLDDIANNPAYGKLFNFSFPARSTPSLIFNKFAQYDQIVPLDFVVVDYLGLLTSERPRVQRREELDDLVRDIKALALDFRGGAGIPVEAGFQTNRQSFERARNDGYYDLRCFSECNEVEKSADSALWLLSQPQNPDELKVGFVKNRDNELGEPFHVARDFKHARIASLKSKRGRETAKTGAGLLDV